MNDIIGKEVYMIREVVSGDYEYVKGLISQVNDFHYGKRPDMYMKDSSISKDKFLEWISSEVFKCFVYESNGNILGVVLLSVESNSKFSEYFINILVVDEDKRGVGIGTKLYRYVERLAIRNSIDFVKLVVWPFNENAVRFYESLGYSVRNIVMEKSISDKYKVSNGVLELVITSEVK